MDTLLPIHTEIKNKLYQYYVNKKIPHILFYGENGCGKKTLVMEFINMIYGHNKEKIKQNTLFTTCSHSKGIKYIREILKEYSRSNVRQEENIYFKTIVLFNFENLSSDGQSALRRVIESYSNTTRFFLVLQNKQKILQPILSRFAHIFVPLPLINGVPTNLHKYHISRIFGGDCSVPDITASVFDNIIKWSKEGEFSPTHKDMILEAEKLYNSAYSCIDLLGVLQGILPHKKITEVMMFFHKIKSEFRNEKLLILYMLDAIFYGTGIDDTEFQ